MSLGDVMALFYRWFKSKNWLKKRNLITCMSFKNSTVDFFGQVLAKITQSAKSLKFMEYYNDA